MELKKGIILKGIGGFYYVKTTTGVLECKAIGKFRNEKTTPYVGDTVFIEINKNIHGSHAVIKSIEKRKNSLIRPPIANIDKMIIVLSVCDPVPNMVVIDKLIAIACSQGIKPVIVISKTDLEKYENLFNIYNNSCIKTILFSSIDKLGIDEIKKELRDNVSVFTGNTGVGKSTILNCIDKNLQLKTGVTSKKLGRGKHTTRHVELFELTFGGFVADTPGFSSLDIKSYMNKEELSHCFKDIEPFAEHCKFNSCSHISELGCGVISAVESGKVHRSRYRSYTSIYREIKDMKNWDRK